MEIKKGVVFTYDALIAASLIVGLVLVGLYDTHYTSNAPKHSLDTYYVASDILTILQTYDLKKIKQYNYSFYEDLISSLNLTKDYYKDDKSLGELIVLAYIMGRYDVISKIMDYLFSGVDGNFLISVNGSDVYYHNVTPFSSVVSSAMLPVSGYAENKAPLGYVARAYATKIERTTTLVYPIYVGGSSPALWFGIGDDYTQTKLFYVDAESDDIVNASLYFAIHYGGDETSDISHIYINDVDVKDKLIWLWEDSGYSVGAYGYVNISDYIKPGWNNFSISFSNPYFHAHTHPGGRIEVLVKKRNFFKPSRYINKTYYLDDAVGRESYYWIWGSGSGAWQIFDFYVPPGATLYNATLYLNLQDVDDVYNNYYVPHDIMVIFNGNTIYANDAASGDYYLSFDIMSYIKEGTNYLAVYVDCYGNTFRGHGVTRIYSDPENDPLHSSRVFLNYSVTNLKKYYGYVDVVKVVEFSDLESYIDYQNVYLNTSASILESFIHVVQKYSYNVSILLNNNSGFGNVTVYVSQGTRDVPSSIFTRGDLWNTTGNTTFYFYETCTGCDYLEWTNAELKLMVPSFVSYGRVFEKREDAEKDAVERLKAVLGSEVKALEIVNDTLSTGSIPWMYGPMLLEVKVWR